MSRFYKAFCENRKVAIHIIWFRCRPYLLFIWDEIDWHKTKLMEYSANDYHYEHHYYIPAWQWGGIWFDGEISYIIDRIKKEIKEEMTEIRWNDFIYFPFRKRK